MAAELRALADDYWEFESRTNPTIALLLGDARFAAEMESLDRASEDDKIRDLDDFAARAEALNTAGLSTADRVTRGVLIEEARGKADQLRSRMAEFDVNPSHGIHVALPQIAGQIRLHEPEHADAIVEKWSRIRDTFQQKVFRLRQGLVAGRTPPRVAVEKAIAQVDRYLATPVDDDPFIAVQAPEAFTDDQTSAWRERLREQVVDSIRPGYELFREALADEVIVKARPQERSGVCWLPDGDEIYAKAVRRHTTMHMTALDVHDIGLEVIQQLADEYRFMGTRVLGITEVTEIYERLRIDPELRFETAEQILAAAESAMDRAAAALPMWFGRVPRTDCHVVEIPDLAAAEAPLAFYLPPARDGSRAGTYYVNTSAPTTRTRYEAEALAFHESVPGHHLQIAIAQELEDVPEFQKHALITAYVEGWGLYTERLSDEMGLFSGDLERLGMLSFDSWRACRLVVDTGVHALGWSRQEAIRYMQHNSPQAANNIETEVDRYIGWPGQALAYMIGRREIVRLRSMAQQEMGSAFDIKGFHDVVLGSGSVPLPLLAELVEEWAAG